MGRGKCAHSPPLPPAGRGLRKLPIAAAEKCVLVSHGQGPSASPFPLAITSSKLLLLQVRPLRVLAVPGP